MRRITVRSIFWVGIASLAFFVMASSSPQCSQTTDQAFTPSLDTAEANGPCHQACIEDFQTRKKAERDRYTEARDACNGDRECQDLEFALNKEILDEIRQDKDECQTACQHNQGSADGGQ